MPTLDDMKLNGAKSDAISLNSDTSGLQHYNASNDVVVEQLMSGAKDWGTNVPTGFKSHGNISHSKTVNTILKTKDHSFFGKNIDRVNNKVYTPRGAV